MRFSSPALAAALVLTAVYPVHAGSGANTRWFSNVNTHATVIRKDGTFWIVSGNSGDELYDAGMCKAVAPSSTKMGRAWSSQQVMFCTRDSTRSPKWKWTESEFHLRRVNGKPVWTLHWPNDAREKDRAVPELASFELLLDRIPCEISFGSNDDKTNEWISISAPFGMCRLKDLKGSKLQPGRHSCDGPFDNAFLAKRTVSLVNRGTADQPALLIAVTGRAEKACRIVEEVRY